MTSVIVEVYSEKAIVVRNTLEHHGQILTSLGGTFNERLKGGRGWIFPKHMLTQIRNMVEKLNSGQYGNEYEQKPTQAQGQDSVSKSDYLSLLSRVERLEALYNKLQKTNENEPKHTKESFETKSFEPKRLVPVQKESKYEECFEEDNEPFEPRRLVPVQKEKKQIEHDEMDQPFEKKRLVPVQKK
jgi:hypothetical protein